MDGRISITGKRLQLNDSMIIYLSRVLDGKIFLLDDNQIHSFSVISPIFLAKCLKTKQFGTLSDAVMAVILFGLLSARMSNDAEVSACYIVCSVVTPIVGFVHAFHQKEQSDFGRLILIIKNP